MALTRVSPALFQVSNNITSVTVGGSANTISLTFDSNGVITGASNNALLISNTAITGNIISSQIAPNQTLYGNVSVVGTASIGASDAIMTIGDNRRTVSTSTTTGAIVSGGGLGVWGDIYAGGILSIAGGQIKFPASQSASSDANTLDDYEEGTYTPVITGSGSGGPFTFGTQSGYYTKIGREVKVSMFMSHNSTVTFSGAYKISLPFSTSDYGGGGFVSYVSGWTSQSPKQFQIEASTTYGYLRGESATEMLDLQQGYIGNNTSFMLTILYKTS